MNEFHINIYDQIGKSRSVLLAGLIGGIAVQALTGDPNAAAAIAGGAMSTTRSSLLNFTRVQEGAADQAGFSFLKKSGKSLCGVISFLELLESMDPYYRQNAYSQTHPLTRERIEDARNAAKNENCENNFKKKLTNITPSELSIDEKDKFIQVKLIGFIDPENAVNTIKDNPKFNEDQKKYGYAIANYKMFNLKKGNELMDQLIKKYPTNPYFYELKAQMLRENGFLKQSLENYLIVNKLMPNDPLIQIELAHTLLNLDSNNTLDESVKILLKAQKKEPENNKLWYLLSVAYGKNSQMSESRYASAYSAYLKGDDEMALSFIQRAKKITSRTSETWKKLDILEEKINLNNKNRR